MNVGLSIKVALAKKDMKKSDLAREMGWSAQYVHKICKSNDLGMGSVIKLSEYFGLKVSEFIALGE